MKTRIVLVVVLTLSLCFGAAASPPVVTNIRAAQLAGTKNVEILYDVSDADGDALTIAVQVSGDAGASYTIPATALSGHIGAGVAPGVNRRIVWNAGADWNGQLVSSAKVRVTASDGTTPAPPPGMVYIPAGVFQMGDANDGDANALPLHNVTVNAFFMDRTEVAKELWQAVQTWGAGNGYGISAGAFKASGHPVQTITWYDAVKWCNARSEKEGLTPCYYTDLAQTAILRVGTPNLTNDMVKWTANGYRLPSEAEWEKAARGGSMGLRYPWGNTISGNQANYFASGDPFENSGDPYSTPVGYYNGNQTPTGGDMANGYGLYDMAGNMWEWCWDWYGSAYYGDPTANNNPHGPTAGPGRCLRGGGWSHPATPNLRCANRAYNGVAPENAYTNYGFRSVRGL